MIDRYYVYMHRFSNNTVYIGKGCGKRVYDNRRNSYWNALKNKYGFPVRTILFDGLSEKEALDKEVEVIEEFKDFGVVLCNLTDGGEGMSGYKHPPEALEKIRESSRGNTNFLGRKHTEAAKKKVSAAQKGRVKTKEHLDKIVLGFSLPVICLDTGVIYKSSAEAARVLGLHKSGISRCCKNQLQTSGGYRWAFAT